jgi:hypothetical protein
MSPKRDLINDFKKDPCPKFYYMPIWEEKELENIACFYPMIPKWSDDYKVLGGVPRALFQSIDVSAEDALKRACMTCNLVECINYVKAGFAPTENFTPSHTLIHIKSFSSPFTSAEADFATVHAMNTLYATKAVTGKDEMYFMLEYCEKKPVIASFYGNIFEEYALKVLEKGGEFKYRELHDTYIGSEKSIHILESKMKEESRVLDGMEPRLYKAMKNYRNIDAWMPGVGAFQMTVSTTHPVKDPARLKEDLAKLGDEGGKLFFAIPSTLYDEKEFKKQKPKDINQHVLRIPLLSEAEMLAWKERSKIVANVAGSEVVQESEDDRSRTTTGQVIAKRRRLESERESLVLKQFSRKKNE